MVRLVLFFAVVLITGCSHTPDAPLKKVTTESISTLFNHRLFVAQTIPSEASLFALPDTEKQKLQQHFARMEGESNRKDEILAHYLKNKLEGFSYDGDTLTATEALTEQAGNCISLALLTQAYANELGIETGFSRVDSFPLYRKHHNVILTSSHFKTKLFAQSRDNNEAPLASLFRIGTVVDYFPDQSSIFSGNANYADLVSKFFANLAADALLDEQYNQAYSLILAALTYTPEEPEVINIAALLHKRIGDRQSAKRLFAYAFSNQLISTNLLLNYLSLLEPSEQPAREQVMAQLDDSPKSPFDTLSLASSYVAQQRYSKAKRLVTALLENYHYIPEVHAELAKIAYFEGNFSQASDYLKQAMLKSKAEHKRSQYLAKRAALSHYTD